MSSLLKQALKNANVPCLRRFSTAPSQQAHRVFNRDAKVVHRNFAAALPDSSSYDYLRDAVASSVVDRLTDITREFPIALDLGANTGNILKHLDDRGGVKKLFMLDSSRGMLDRDKDIAQPTVEVQRIVGDEDGRLPFEDKSLDLVMSSMSLHWSNNIEGVLTEVKRVLKPDGVFLGAMIGGETLHELRTAFALAEMDRDGGVSPHTSPFMTVPDMGNMLVAAGFGLPTVDSETITVEYPDVFTLFEHLQKMGESNASYQMRQGIRRSTLIAAAAAYQGMFGKADDAIPATFQLIHFIGWAPAPSQPSPLRRGSVSKGFGARGSGPPPSPAALPSPTPELKP